MAAASISPGQRARADDEIRAYYHRVLPFFDQELADRGDAELWAWAAATPPSSRVLELGAGTGRATSFLVRTAGQVVALDLAPELIAVARRRLADHPNVKFLVADMRDVALRARFDLVVAVDDPFVHLTRDEDRERAFAAAARHLAPGGRFLLDAAWLSPQRRRAAARPEGLRIERSGRGSLEIRELWRCDPVTRICFACFEYRLRNRPVEQVSFAARLWSKDELEERAHAADLRITRLWGDYDRRPWNRETSPRLLAELRPREQGSM
jgi:SAM-dependent methyltransferase